MKFVYFKTWIFCDSHPLNTNKMYTTYIYLQPSRHPSIQKVMSRKKRLNMMSQMRMTVLKTRWRTGVTRTSRVICYLEQRIWLIRQCKRMAEWQLQPMIMRHPLTIKRQMGRIHYWKRTRQKIGQRPLREVMYFSCRKDLFVPAIIIIIITIIIVIIYKPVLSRHRIKRTPSIKRTVAVVPKSTSLIYFKWNLY